MNDLIGVIIFLSVGFIVTYYQSKWFAYDPDKDF